LNLESVGRESERMAPSSGTELQPWTAFLFVKGSRRTYWAIVVVLGFLQAWSHRFQVDHDGVNYLDIADNYASGAWHLAINGYWSPLYSWLLALGAYLFRYPRSLESTFLHLINFAAYLCAYRCFEFFLKELLQEQRVNLQQPEYSTNFSPGCWHLLGLSLFLYSSLYMENHGGSTPDIILSVFVYLSLGLLLRIRAGHANWFTFACFGAALSFGYFAKTAMFPLAFVFLGVSAVVVYRQPKKPMAFLLAPLCFLLIAAPWLILLSQAKGRFTFGDAGRLAYAKFVRAEAAPSAWSGVTEDGDHLVHPPRRLGDNPPVIEFATPLPGTFPLWYDGSYWLEGQKPHFSLKGQFRVLRLNANNYVEYLNNQPEYLVLLLLMVFLQGSVIVYFRGLLRLWPLFLPSLAAIGMYALVYLEPRYVAAFLVVLWLSAYTAIRLPVNEVAKLRHFVQCAVLATVSVTGIVLARGASSDIYSILRPRAYQQLEVAKGLQRLGVPQGSFVSLIGTSKESTDWARLAGLRIVSLVPNENVNQFWFGSPDTQEKVRAYFVESGSVAVITDEAPAGASLSGWKRIEETSYFIYKLQDR
jgi:hypothetical protein